MFSLLCANSHTHSLFHSRLKTFLFCKSFPPQPFLFLLWYSLHGFPRLFTVISEHVCFLVLVFLFLDFLVVGSVRQIKLTHVGFRAHVKIASRIVSYSLPRVQRHCGSSCSGLADSASNCGVRRPRFEAHCGRLCLSRQPLRYAVLPCPGPLSFASLLGR